MWACVQETNCTTEVRECTWQEAISFTRSWKQVIENEGIAPVACVRACACGDECALSQELPKVKVYKC